MLIDTHCHLDSPDYDGQREELLARAEEVGVLAVINPGTDFASSQKAVDLARRFEAVYAAVGIHPNYGEDWDVDSVQQLAELAQNPKVVAIGEIGLDYYRDRTPREKQMQILLDQLDLAADLGLPVIIHNREAGKDLMPVLSAWQSNLVAQDSPLADAPGVLHSFSADLALAEKALAHNFRIGFTGPITFRNAPELQALAAELPLESLLVETDGPYLSPHPHRGRRNEPGRVKIIAEKLAELKKMTFDRLAEVTTANALSLFNMEVVVR